MKLAQITCAGVRGVPDGEYSFTNQRTGVPLDLVIITGGPASGKTSLLEAIAATKEAVGPYGMPPDPKRLRRAGAKDARIVATWVLSATELERAHVDESEQTVTWDLASGSVRADAPTGMRRLFGEFSRDPARGKIEYFHANRRLSQGPPAMFSRPSAEAEARSRAARDPDKYACVVDGLRALALAEATRATRDENASPWAPFVDALAAMLPDLRFDGLDLAGGGVRFLREAGEVVGTDELSSSEVQAALFALSFTYLGLSGSLVLIDEPELHVHFAQRARFLQALLGLGSDNQVIVATGAVELITGPGHVINLDRAHAGRGLAPNHELGATPERAPTPDRVPVATAEVAPGAALLLATSCEVPSYLQASPPPLQPPPLRHDDSDETAQLQAFVVGPALPFVASSSDEAGLERQGDVPRPPIEADDAGSTCVLPAAGKRLIRFDPQTGRPLPEPIWVDAPEPSTTKRPK